MALPSTPSFNALVVRWRSGDNAALRVLIPLVYDELRHLAHRYLKRERQGHTLQTTALVHEAYMRLADQQPDFADRTHFMALSARLMRQILVDYARSYRATKRGAGLKEELTDAVSLPPIRSGYLIALDDALKELGQVDERQCTIVELKYFGGLTTGEIAQFLDISPSTAKRDWNVARAWLARQMKSDVHEHTASMAAP